MAMHMLRVAFRVGAVAFLAAVAGCSGGSDGGGGTTSVAPAGTSSATMTAQAGASQSAPAGTAVAVAPTVRLLDSNGRGAAGVEVTFAIVAGGGSVSPASATTDSDGVARADTWTLGVIGENRLAARAAGYPEVVFAATATPPGSTGGTPTVTRTVFLGGLQNPWDMAFPPDGVMLYTERARGLSVRLANGITRLLYLPPDLAPEGQNGVLGVALDPQYATNRTVYLYIASRANGSVDNRVIALSLDAGYTAASARRDVLTGITNANGAHSGGRVRFGPDGFLYVTTGDTRQGAVPQNLTRLGGKVLRIDRDGNAASGNGAPAGADPRIFAYGFRNVQGLDFRPGSGVPFIAEHGPGYSDEVTPLRPGGNGGWDPLCADRISYCGYDGNTRMTDTAKFPGALLPAWTTGSVSRGTAGGAFANGAAWRDWNGAFVIAQLSGLRLEVLKLDAAGTSAVSAPLFESLGVRLRAVVRGPDGALYVSTDGEAGGDEIWRLAPG